jgi:hypothetical protein
MVFRPALNLPTFHKFLYSKGGFLVHVFVINVTSYKTNSQAKPLVNCILPIIKQVKYTYLNYEYLFLI